jgi:hypothetical protein
MPTSFIVVDDFLSPADAHGLRQAALGLTYPAQEGAFPGRNSQQRLELDGCPSASRLVNEPLRPVNPLQSHGKFRLTLASDVGRAKVHRSFALVRHPLPERTGALRGGTEFFRHRRTNTERMAWTPTSWLRWATPTAATCIATSSSATATTTASGK